MPKNSAGTAGEIVQDRNPLPVEANAWANPGSRTRIRPNLATGLRFSTGSSFVSLRNRVSSRRTQRSALLLRKERGSRTALRAAEYTKLLSLAVANPRDDAILQVFLQTNICVS